MDPDTRLHDAVARLIRQLEINEWVNREGHKINNNTAFQDVKKLLSAS
jgi:hypothetical protein